MTSVAWWQSARLKCRWSVVRYPVSRTSDLNLQTLQAARLDAWRYRESADWLARSQYTVGLIVGPAASISVWQHVQSSKHIRP